MREFFSYYAVYEGVTYRVKNYQDRVELFAIEDKERKDVIMSVPKDKLDDNYSLINDAILNGIRYVFYDIEDKQVTYGTAYKDSPLLQRDITDFDLIYQRVLRGKNEPVEKRAIYPENSEALIKEFYPQERPDGSVMFSVDSKKISAQDLIDVIRILYKGKVREGRKDVTADVVIKHVSVGGIELRIVDDLCWEITDICPEQKGRGEDLIFEILAYLNEYTTRYISS